MSIKRQIFGFELKTSLNLKIILFKQNTTIIGIVLQK